MEKLSEKLFSSSYGDYNDAQILNDENMKNQFILENKKNILLLLMFQKKIS